MLTIILIALTVGALAPDFSLVSATGPMTPGFVVATNEDNRILKLDLDGNIIWSADIGSRTSDVSVNLKDRSVVAVSDQYLVKLDSNGNEVWKKDISHMYSPFYSAPADVDVYPTEGSIYVLAHRTFGFLAEKYDSNGDFIFRFPEVESPFRTYTVTGIAVNPPDGNVYFNTHMNGVYKFDSDGKLLWHGGTVGEVLFARTIAVNPYDGGCVVCIEGCVERLTASGYVVWRQPPTGRPSWRQESIAIDPLRNSVYWCKTLMPGAAICYKLNWSNGRTVWAKALSFEPDGVAVNYDDGTVYVTSSKAKALCKINPTDGSIIWSKNLGYAVGAISANAAFPSPPIARFTFSPAFPYAGQSITFDASDSYDPDGAIVSYLWDFGDGSMEIGIATSHRYQIAGTYTVTLTAVDNDGKRAKPQRILEIQPWPTLVIAVTQIRIGSTETTTIELADEDYDGFIIHNISNNLLAAVKRTHDATTFDFPKEYTATKGAWTITLSSKNDYTVTLT